MSEPEQFEQWALVEAPADWEARVDGSLGVLERIACELVRILGRERTQRVIQDEREHYARKAQVMRMLSDHLAWALIEAEMEACPECLGTGEIGFGNDPAAWRRCPACEERQHALEMLTDGEAAWVFAQAERSEPPVPSPATQPVAPSPEAPVDTQGNSPSIEHLLTINAKLDRLLRHLGLLREDWRP